jgi:hypothetical protein
MAKRKRDDTVETKDVNDKEEDTQPTVKRLSLHPLWSLRKDVLGNPNLLGLTASFLELKDHIALGKSHKSANQKLLKGDRGMKLKETATYCCLCKRGWIIPRAQTFFREVGEFKAGYYCVDCMPTKCDGCDSHYKFSHMYQREDDDNVYCEGCYDELDEKEEEEEDEGEEEFTCDKCGNDYVEEDMNGDNCVGCDPPSEEEEEEENESVCKLCDRWFQSEFIRFRMCYGCAPELKLQLELHK